MEDLKQYKEVWQKQELVDNKLDTNTLSKMIRKRSSSIVKWIFYISIIEFVILTLINIFGSTDLKELENLGLYNFFIGISILTYLIPIIFIFLFYKNYKRIQVTSNAKELMQSIMKTRQTVKYYIFITLALIAFALLYGFSVAIHSPEYVDIIEDFGDNGQLIIWSIVILFTIIAIGIFLLFYLLIYGILLKKLQTNYKELIS
jgi:hypothetical protein